MTTRLPDQMRSDADIWAEVHAYVRDTGRCIEVTLFPETTCFRNVEVRFEEPGLLDGWPSGSPAIVGAVGFTVQDAWENFLEIIEEEMPHSV